MFSAVRTFPKTKPRSILLEHAYEFTPPDVAVTAESLLYKNTIEAEWEFIVNSPYECTKRYNCLDLRKNLTQVAVI